MQRNRTIALGAAAVAAALCAVTAPAHAAQSPAPPVPSPVTQQQRWDQMNAATAAYQQAHPEDYAGLERLVMSFGGAPLQVSFPDAGPMTGAEAQKHIAAHKSSRPIQTEGGIPEFSIALSATTIFGSRPGQRIQSHWDFPDQWAGQADPKDLSSFGFNPTLPSCLHVANVHGNTYTYNGTPTGQTSPTSILPEGGTLFETHDYESAFVSQADHGYQNIDVWDYCSGAPKQYGVDYHYEANQGGGNWLSVTFGWGLLSVDYDGQAPLRRQEAAQPVYFTL